MDLFKEYPHLRILQSLAAKKKESVYLVGGFLRDYVLNIPSDDLDFAVENDALGIAGEFAKEVKGAYVELDKDHSCARVVKKMKNRIFVYDFAGFRAKTLKGDLTKRDFTINTLSLDISLIKVDTALIGLIKDYKMGLIDLKERKIKQASKNVFKEDALRILRAFSLKAQLGFTIERQTLIQIKEDKDLLGNVSSERIREELFKILKAPHACGIIKAMDRLGILEKVIPQIKVMAGCKQGGYHHLDVWPHSVEALNQLEKFLLNRMGSLKGLTKDEKEEILTYLDEKTAGEHTRLDIVKLACLLHDIGKPDTRKKEDGRVSFHGHEHVGKNIVRAIAHMLKLSIKERHSLEDMVLWHLRPGYLSNFKRPTKKAVYRFFRDAKEEAVSILILSLADQRATRGPLTSEKDQSHHEKICLTLVKEAQAKRKETPFVRLINGTELMKELKIPSSPVIGLLLKEIEENQILGKIKTKNEAFDWAKNIQSKGLKS